MPRVRSVVLSLAVCATLLLTPGCDGKPPVVLGSQQKVDAAKRDPVRARERLAQLQIEYSPEKFIETARNGDTTAIRLFLETGMDVNTVVTFDQTPLSALMAAAAKGRTETVK